VSQLAELALLGTTDVACGTGFPFSVGIVRARLSEVTKLMKQQAWLSGGMFQITTGNDNKSKVE